MSAKNKVQPAGPVPVTKKIAFKLLALTHVVCPLLFFTNLTRNPYYTQIALLNILISIIVLLWAVEAWRTGEFELPRVPFEIPLALFLGLAFVGVVLSWMDHEIVRAGIVYESIRVWVFTLVNSAFAFYLPLLFTKPLGEEPEKFSIWTDIILALLWCGLWFGFHTMKNQASPSLIWDTYGGFLWILAIVYALVRAKSGEAIAFFHLIFAVTIVAGLYGLMQYMGRDIIWSSPIQPYGGRPVSTFGNPNFLSSYVMLVSPVALAFGLKSSGNQAKGYYLVAFIAALSALGTLTRSTYVGLFFTFAALGVFLFRREHIPKAKWALVALGVFVLAILLFPHSTVSESQSPLARLTEIYGAIKSGEPYQPWHQRILIWSSAWDMVKERPFFGKGWGAFELFYPFYQGKYLFSPLFAGFRTHANNAHNVLLEIWAQVGYLGTGMALWILVTLFSGGWIILKRQTTGLGHYVSAALLAGLVGMVADNFFGNVSIFFAVPAFLFWWNMGALYHESRAPHVFKRPVSTLIGRPALVLLMAICLITVFYFIKRWKQETYYFEGFKAAKVGRIEKSYKALEKAYAWFEGEVNSNYEMGNSYSQFALKLQNKGLEKEAISFNKKAAWAYRTALHANPGYDEIYYNLGVMEMKLGNLEEAARKLEISLYINPKLVAGYGSLGNLYVRMKRLDDAVRIYKQAVVVYPENRDFWNNLGYCYSQQENHEESFRAFKQALTVDPTFFQAWNNLQAASRALKRSDPISLVPDLIRKLNDFVNAKRYQESLPVARKIVSIVPTYHHARLSLANILFYLGKHEESIKEFQIIIEQRPRFVQAYVNLGRLYQHKKEFELARAHYQGALKIDRFHPEATQALKSLPF